jgi:hypothetical protein
VRSSTRTAAHRGDEPRVAQRGEKDRAENGGSVAQDMTTANGHERFEFGLATFLAGLEAMSRAE